MEDGTEHYGPLMQGLTEHQRAFVIQLLTNPHKPATDWARAAGFADSGSGGIRVRASQLRHNPKILAAAREEAGRHLNREGVAMAVAVLLHELASPDAKTRLAAANSILDRGGVTAKTEHTVRVEHNVEQMEAIAQRLAVELGIEPMKLIGGNTIAAATPASDTRVTIEREPEPNLAGTCIAHAMGAPWCVSKCENPKDCTAKPHGSAERVRQQMEIDSDVAF